VPGRWHENFSQLRRKRKGGELVLVSRFPRPKASFSQLKGGKSCLLGKRKDRAAGQRKENLYPRAAAVPETEKNEKNHEVSKKETYATGNLSRKETSNSTMRRTARRKRKKHTPASKGAETKWGLFTLRKSRKARPTEMAQKYY